MKAQSLNRTEKKKERPSKAEKVYNALQREKQRQESRKKEVVA